MPCESLAAKQELSRRLGTQCSRNVNFTGSRSTARAESSWQIGSRAARPRAWQLEEGTERPRSRRTEGVWQGNVGLSRSLFWSSRNIISWRVLCMPEFTLNSRSGSIPATRKICVFLWFSKQLLKDVFYSCTIICTSIKVKILCLGFENVRTWLRAAGSYFC